MSACYKSYVVKNISDLKYMHLYFLSLLPTKYNLMIKIHDRNALGCEGKMVQWKAGVTTSSQFSREFDWLFFYSGQSGLMLQ